MSWTVPLCELENTEIADDERIVSCVNCGRFYVRPHGQECPACAAERRSEHLARRVERLEAKLWGDQ